MPVQTQFKLILKEQFDLGLHCLPLTFGSALFGTQSWVCTLCISDLCLQCWPFRKHILDILPGREMTCSNSRIHTLKTYHHDIQIFRAISKNNTWTPADFACLICHMSSFLHVFSYSKCL